MQQLPHNVRMTGGHRPDDSWVRQTLLVRHWNQRKAEIDTHKWYESERAGCDIGYERAAIRYTIHQSMLRCQQS